MANAGSTQRKGIKITSDFASRLSGVQFRAAMEHSPIGTALVGLDGRWRWTNVALREMLGYSRQELARRTFQDITHPPDLDLDLKSVEALVAGSTHGYQIEKRYIRKDGSLVWALLTVALVSDSARRPDYFIAKIQDISDRKFRELERAVLNERLTLATRAGGVGVWEWDIITDKLIWDGRMYELYDVPLEVKPEYGTFLSRVHERDRERINQELADAVAGLRPYDTEFAVVSTDLGERQLRALATVIHEDGQPSRMIGTNWDVSDARRLMTLAEESARTAQLGHERIQALQSQLIELSRASAMSTLAAAIAHEINQPLAATSNFIAAASAQVARGNANPESIADLLTHANRTVLRAGEIMRRLRAMVRRGESRSVRIDMADVISEASEFGLTPMLTKGVNYRERIGKKLFFNGDSLQMQQVLLNLIRNAVDAVSGAPTQDVLLTATREGATIKICVADSGPGVPSGIKEHLFEAFRSTKPDGMGIGLSICRAIVEAYGGRIWVEDAPDGGSVFCFVIPASSKSSDGEPTAVLGS